MEEKFATFRSEEESESSGRTVCNLLFRTDIPRFFQRKKNLQLSNLPFRTDIPQFFLWKKSLQFLFPKMNLIVLEEWCVTFLYILLDIRDQEWFATFCSEHICMDFFLDPGI